MYKTHVGLTITSEKPWVKSNKVKQAETWIKAALTMAFSLLGSFGKYGITAIEPAAETSVKEDDGA